MVTKEEYAMALQAGGSPSEIAERAETIHDVFASYGLTLVEVKDEEEEVDSE